MRIITRQDMEQIKVQHGDSTQPYTMPQGMYVDVTEFPNGCIFPDGSRFEYVQTSPKNWIKFGDYCKFGNSTLFSVPCRFGYCVQFGKHCMAFMDMTLGKGAILGEHFQVNNMREKEKPMLLEIGAYSQIGPRFESKANVQIGQSSAIGEDSIFYGSAEIGKQTKIANGCRFQGRAVFDSITYFDGVCKFGESEEIEAIGAVSMDIPVSEGRTNTMTVYYHADDTFTEVCMSGGRLHKSSAIKSVQIAKILFRNV